MTNDTGNYKAVASILTWDPRAIEIAMELPRGYPARRYMGSDCYTSTLNFLFDLSTLAHGLKRAVRHPLAVPEAVARLVEQRDEGPVDFFTGEGVH